METVEMKRLEKNLSHSAMKAKPFYVRGMTGLLESEQGFFSIAICPVYNPFTKEQSQLETVLRDIENFHEDYLSLLDKHQKLERSFEQYKLEQNKKEKEMEENFKLMLKRIQDLELFNLD